MSYLLLAILISTSIVVLFRYFENLRVDVNQAITVNYMVAGAFGYIALNGDMSVHEISVQGWFPIALILGLFFIIGFYLFAFSAVKAGVAVTAVSSKMSVLIPVMAGFILFGEAILPFKIAGIVLAVGSFIMVLWKRGSSMDFRYVFLPVLLLLANGINDTLLKTAQHHHIVSNTGFIAFLTTIFLVAMVFGIIFLLFRVFSGKSSLSWTSVLAGIALGLLNWGSTWYFLKGLSVFDVSLFIPVFNAGLVILSTIAGRVIFRENLTRLNLVGIVLALVAITMIAWK